MSLWTFLKCSLVSQEDSPPQHQGSSIKGPVLRKAFQKFQFPLKSYLRLSTVVICCRTTLRLAVFNNMSGGWSNSSVAKSTGCPSRGPGFHSQLTIGSDTSLREPYALFWYPWALHTCGSGNRREGAILKVLAALAEDPGDSQHAGDDSHHPLQVQLHRLNTLFWPLRVLHTQTCRQNTHRHKIKVNP